MKKILITAAILFAGIIMFQSCANNRQREQASRTDTSQNPTAPEIEGLSEMPIAVSGRLDSLEGLLTDNIAVEMSQAYRDDSSKSHFINRRGNVGNDARSIWFSLETIKRFIKEIERAVPRGDGRPVLGVRIYYAKYPKLPDARLSKVDSTFQGRHTLFMVPTYLDINGINTDFNFYAVGDNPYRPTPYYKLLNSGAKPAILGGANLFKHEYTLPNGMVVTFMSTSDGIQNQGGLAPPPATGGTFPTPKSGD